MTALFAGAQQQVGIDKIVPSIEQLGAGWTSNRVVVLIDALSSPSERVEEGSSWLKFARDLLHKEPRREAYAMVRFYREGAGPNPPNYIVWIGRWRDKHSIPTDWGHDKETKDLPGALPKLGEEVRCSQRDGMHNDISFVRGNYLITAEGAIPWGWDHVTRLAEICDRNLLNAQNSLTNAPQAQPGRSKLASISRVAVLRSNREAKRLYQIEPFQEKDGDLRSEGQQLIWEGLTSARGHDVVSRVAFDKQGSVISVDVRMLTHPGTERQPNLNHLIQPRGHPEIHAIPEVMPK